VTAHQVVYICLRSGGWPDAWETRAHVSGVTYDTASSTPPRAADGLRAPRCHWANSLAHRAAPSSLASNLLRVAKWFKGFRCFATAAILDLAFKVDRTAPPPPMDDKLRTSFSRVSLVRTRSSQKKIPGATSHRGAKLGEQVGQRLTKGHRHLVRAFFRRRLLELGLCEHSGAMPGSRGGLDAEAEFSAITCISQSHPCHLNRLSGVEILEMFWRGAPTKAVGRHPKGNRAPDTAPLPPTGPAGGGGAAPTRKAQGLCVEEAHRGAGGPSESWLNSLMKQEDEGSLLGISCMPVAGRQPYNLNPRNRKRTRSFISALNSAVLSEGVRNAHQTANLRQSKSPLEKAD